MFVRALTARQALLPQAAAWVDGAEEALQAGPGSGGLLSKPGDIPSFLTHLTGPACAVGGPQGSLGRVKTEKRGNHKTPS